MQVAFLERADLLRKKDSHDDHVKIVTDDPKKVSMTGVIGPSALNELGYFHVTENFTPDVMHDCLEGVCPYELTLLLKVIILEKQYVTLETLNDRIRSFADTLH